MRSLFCIICSCVATSAVYAHEGDIGLAVVNGRIVVGGVTQNPVTMGSWIVPGQRVFGGELDAAGFAADPGLFSGSLGEEGGPITMPAAAALSFTLEAPLMQWTGSGFASTSNTMRVEFASGAQSATTPASGSAAGFSISTGPTGAFDEHYDFYLEGPASMAPSIGVYLLQLNFSLPGSSILSGESVYLVFNFGAEETDHDAAIEWVEMNIVPAPGTAAILAFGTAVGFRRRR